MADVLPVQGTAASSLSPRTSVKRPSPPSQKRVALSRPAATAARLVAPTELGDKHGGATQANGAGGSAGAAGCRLLWRGRLTNEHGRPLHGLAVIAHLFSVSSSLSPPPAASSVSPFDDPFSSASSATASGADMCLGLEMLRGAPITVKGDVRVRRKGESPDKPPSGKEGKARAKDDVDVELVDVETPTDVRVYIDSRCPETVEWFEDTFCREGRAGHGVKLDAGGEEVILFASLPTLATLSEDLDNRDPSSSTSTPPDRPTLTLLLGRRARATVRKPRPDDPLPRESLFANKLRKTASLPASAFTLSADLPPPAKKHKRQTAKDKVIASLLGKNDEMAPPRARVRATSSQPPGISFPPPPPLAAGSNRPFARSASSRFPSAGSLSSSSSMRKASLPPLASLGVSRRASTSGPPTGGSSGRAFQRTLSRSSMLLDSPPGSDEDLPPVQHSRGGSRAPSPSPSLANVMGEEGDGDDGGEGMDAVAELRSFGAAAAGRRDRANGLARSSSLPVGQFALGLAGTTEKAEKGRRERGETALPSVRDGSVALEGTKEGSVEVRNKNTVKKLTLARMTALGCSKTHLEFRDVFSFTTRGVGFALRATFKSAMLSTSDRELASSLIEQHLRLYLPGPVFPTPSPPPDLATAAVKSEPLEHRERPPPMPSPKSLGDGLDEVPTAATALLGDDGGDVDMEDTQLHVEVEEVQPLVEETMQALGSAKVGAGIPVVDEDDDEADEVVLVTVPGAKEVKLEE